MQRAVADLRHAGDLACDVFEKIRIADRAGADVPLP
jgi:hypothetical protein